VRIINAGQADAILMAREFLREPYWPLRAAQELANRFHGRCTISALRQTTRTRVFPSISTN